MFDYILENRLKMGLYQVKTTSILGLIDFIDGIEYLFLSILISILKIEWDLNNSLYFWGIVIGNVLCAAYADQIGRKFGLCLFMALQFIVVVYTAFVQSMFEMCVIRLLYGAIFGFSLPLSYTIVSEIVQARYRGRISLIVNCLYISGKIYCVLLCFYFLDDYSSGNWRGLILFNSIPVFFCCIFSILVLKESPRYLVSHQKYSQAFNTINLIGYENNGPFWQLLTNEEKDQLIAWQQKVFAKEYQEQSVMELFNSKYRETTIKLWILIGCWNIQNNIIFLLIPFLFQEAKKGFSSLLYIFLGELAMALIIFMFIDNVKFGGRKNILIFCSFILLAINLAIFYFKETFLILFITLFKFFLRGMYAIQFILACESYSSIYRTKGTSSSYCAGKIAAAISPYFIYPLYFYNSYYPFLFNAILTLIHIYVSCTYPLELTQQRLDELNSNEDKEGNEKE